MPMEKGRHWTIALPVYLRISPSYFVMVSVAPLGIVLLGTLWGRFTAHHWALNRAGIAYAMVLGAFFFLLAFLTAVSDDIRRNWRALEPTVAWNPQRMWRNFLYLSTSFFFVAIFLAYHQGAWLSVAFLALAILSAITVKKCF
jgi:hypothetical protein